MDLYVAPAAAARGCYRIANDQCRKQCNSIVSSVFFCVVCLLSPYWGPKIAQCFVQNNKTFTMPRHNTQYHGNTHPATSIPQVLCAYRHARGHVPQQMHHTTPHHTTPVLATTGTPSDPGQPAAGHASAGPPRPGPSDVAAESVSQDLLGADCREEGHQQALASALGAPAARPQTPAGNPMTAQAHDGAEASAPPTEGHPPEGPALDWCTVCRFWRPSPCDQCPPHGAPQEEDEAAEQAPEGERELRPRETSPALDTPTSHAADDPPPPPIDLDASQGTATQLAGLLDDEAGALSRLEPLPPAVELDDDPAPPAAGRADSPPGELGPHESRLAALIADTALEEANPCKALDVAVFLDSERLSAVGRRMRAADQDTTPVPGPHSPEGDGLPPLLAQYAKRTRELLQLVGYTLGVPSFSLSSWEGDAIPAPHPPGLGITVYYVIEGRVQLRLPAPEGGSRPGWWLQAMAYAYAWSAPPPPRAVPPDTRALVLICQCPVHVPRGAPATAPPPVQICVKRGDRYTPVDTASMDLGDHKATLTPPGGNPLAIATPMVARATYDRARGGTRRRPLGPGGPAAPRRRLEGMERLVG